MTKPQTVGDQIRAMEPQVVDSPVNPREAWEAARNQAAALADAATPTGWVIANGDNNRWRCVWEWESNAEWTDDIAQALKFATRDDAERYSKEDEDAWLIYQVGIPLTTTPVVGAEHAGDVRQAVPEWGTSDKAQHYAAMVTDTNDADILRVAISDLCRDNERLAVMLKSAKQPDPTPALGWRAMQTAAEAVSKEAHGETVLGGQRFKTVKLEDAVDAILAMTGPTHAQLLAEAVKLEAVRELVKAAKWIGVAAQTTGGTAGPDLDLIEAIDVLANALTQIGGAA